MEDVFNDDWAEWSPDENDFGKCPAFSKVAVDDLPRVERIGAATTWFDVHRYCQNPVRYGQARTEPVRNVFKDYLLARILERNLERYSTFQPPINETTGKPYKSGKAYDAALDALAEQGLIAITQEEKADADAVLTCFDAYPLRQTLKKSRSDLRVGATSTKGVSFAAKIDLYSEDAGIYQVKTTSSRLYDYYGDSFRWSLARLGYLTEAALLAKICWNARGLIPRINVLVFQTSEPFQIKLYEVSRETIKRYWDVIESIEDFFVDEKFRDVYLRSEVV